jgi:acetyl esterase/lipase
MSLRLKLLNSFLRIFVKPLLSQASSPKLARLSFNLVARIVFFTPPLSLQQKEIVTASPRRLTARWISCGQVLPRAVILYIHGGGYVVGHAATIRVCWQTCRANLAYASSHRIIASLLKPLFLHKSKMFA